MQKKPTPISAKTTPKLNPVEIHFLNLPAPSLRPYRSEISKGQLKAGKMVGSGQTSAVEDNSVSLSRRKCRPWSHACLVASSWTIASVVSPVRRYGVRPRARKATIFHRDPRSKRHVSSPSSYAFPIFFNFLDNTSLTYYVEM